MRSLVIPGGLEQAIFGEHPKSSTAPGPTHTFPPMNTVAGTTGPATGSPGVTASSRAPGATLRSCRIVIVPAGM